MAACDSSGGQGGIAFSNNAVAGTGTVFTTLANPVSTKDSGIISFVGKSSAGDGTFINNGGVVSNGGQECLTLFYNDSTAADGTFVNKGGAIAGAVGGGTIFALTSDAGNAVITSEGASVSGASGGVTVFANTASAKNATLVADGELNGGGPGVVEFQNASKGETARVELFGDGNLDVSVHSSPGLTIGSMEGGGNVFLGSQNLAVGSNNLNTTFSGIVQDGGLNPEIGGSLTKTGSAVLTLSGANTYTGGTIVSDGALVIINKIGSATGTGGVQLDAGTLGGKGIIAGAVIVGTGGGTGAFLAPGQGARKPGSLTVQSALNFKADATYSCTLDSKKGRADQVIANGVTIDNGALFSLVSIGKVRLTQGMVFTAISNIAATPIAGAFDNLADGSSFTANGNTFQADYEGGNGNDLTLTVVP